MSLISNEISAGIANALEDVIKLHDASDASHSITLRLELYISNY
jgi:hypothetical protein